LYRWNPENSKIEEQKKQPIRLLLSFCFGAQDGTQFDVQVEEAQKSSDIYNYSRF